MAVTRTLVDTDRVQVVQNKWLEDVRQFQTNVDTLFKHGTINAALSNIGISTRTTIVVTENTAVNANTDLTSYPNISWLFLGAGKLTPATGVTLTMYSGDTILCPPYQQCLDATSGTIAFAKAGWVWPGWFGAGAGAATSANTTALQKLAAAFGSVGGGIHWPGHTIQVSDTIAFTGPVQILGEHRDSSVLESTAAASNKHGLTFTKSHTVKNLTVKTSSNLTSNYTMKAISCDLDGVVSGGLENVYESVKIRGFNIGIYGDGGANYNIDRSSFKNVDITASGPSSDYVGSCMYQNRITQTHLTQVTLDQNNVGEHALYFFGCKNITLDDFKIRNATRSEAQAVKLIGNIASATEAYNVWTVKNVDVENCTNGILIQLYGTESIDAVNVDNCKLVDIDGSTNVPGAVFVEAAGTSNIRQVTVSNCSFRDLGYAAVQFVAATSGGTFRHGVWKDSRVSNWSTASAGTYTAFRTNGDGTYGPIHLENIYADGNTTNGRTIVGLVGQGATITRISTRNLIEVNTTAKGHSPLADSSTSATFDFTIGDSWTVSGTRTITAASNAVPGETYIIIGTNNNCTFTDNSVFLLAGNWTSAANKTLMLKCVTASTLYEVARSAN